MIESIRVEFRKIDSKSWSNSEYQILIKPVDYTETDEDNIFGPDIATQYGSLESGLKRIKTAKQAISQAETVLAFIETKKPERWQIVFFLDENKIRHSNYALNCLEIYF